MRFSFVARVSIAAILVATPIRPAEDLELGKRIWGALCFQCHGADGDLLGYDDIVPIAGIGRRYPAAVIETLAGKFSGRVLYGHDRQAIVAYMTSLRGSKEYPDPGWVVTPYFLERKAPRLHEFRILDTRDKEAYRSGHVTNAVSVEPGPCLADAKDTAEWLGRLGVTQQTMVLVYDERGGPSAACAWWRIRRAGHRWVGVVDGGWQRWLAEGRATTNAMPRIEATTYPVMASKEATTRSAQATSVFKLGADGWNWKNTLGEDGFIGQEQLRRLAENAGLQPGTALRVAGPDRELAHLVLALSLLGYAELDYDPRTSILLLPGR
jgi:hypothetical protein